MPSELSALITDYLYEQPHTWSTFETIEIRPSADGQSTEIAATERKPSSSSYPWRRIVSAATFQIGQLKWSIAFEITGGCRWIGAGVTTSSTNVRRRDWFMDIADADDWIVFASQVNANIQIYNGFKSKNRLIEFSYSRLPHRLRFDFAADPSDAVVTASIWQYDDGCNTFRQVAAPQPIVVASMPDFWRMRPCIVLAGTAVVDVLTDQSF